MSSIPRSLTKVKSIRTEGPVHNLYVTPDGKHVVAGEAGGEGHVSVLDARPTRRRGISCLATASVR